MRFTKGGAMVTEARHGGVSSEQGSHPNEFLPGVFIPFCLRLWWGNTSEAHGIPQFLLVLYYLKRLEQEILFDCSLRLSWVQRLLCAFSIVCCLMCVCCLVCMLYCVDCLVFIFPQAMIVFPIEIQQGGTCLTALNDCTTLGDVKHY